ncbi:OCIA domain-containing protein 1 [Belonocnema kinseyi]|uniref:OCIA domain-containing protein 1 n=1 Tax=Belonocnema kinseyi TaxID=2817044 RepID=UPI00143CD483|nr:OCIA domain-containing protein 1 [Belonocnema kinseyi]
MMNSPFQGGYDTPTSPLSIDPEEVKIQLTAEELRLLKECNNEGIVKRALPLGVAFGFVSHFVSKQKGILNHPKFGTIPLVLASGFAGYFSGRLSYFPVCYERLMQVPDGIVRQRALNRQGPGSLAPYIGQVPVQVDPRAAYSQSRPTDIDVQTMSNFDTMPSNLDSDTPPLPPIGSLGSDTPRPYTSYEELRERNRREYMEKMQRPGFPVQPGYAPVQPGYPPSQPGYPPGQSGYPPSQPVYPDDQMLPPSQPQIHPGQPTYQRRGFPVQPADPELVPNQRPGARRVKNKYGDEWE